MDMGTLVLMGLGVILLVVAMVYDMHGSHREVDTSSRLERATDRDGEDAGLDEGRFSFSDTLSEQESLDLKAYPGVAKRQNDADFVSEE